MARSATPEPYSIDADVIAAFLLRHGWTNAADFVVHLGRRAQEQNVEADRWRAAYADVLERLHRYEPPAAEPARVRYTPPPESSD